MADYPSADALKGPLADLNLNDPPEQPTFLSPASAPFLNLSQNEHQLTFQLKVLNEDLHGHATVMASAVYVWVGKVGTAYLLFGLGASPPALVDGRPMPQTNVFLETVVKSLCRLFGPQRQVFFATDCDGENRNANYAQAFFLRLREFLDSNRDFFGLPAANRSVTDK